MMVKDSQSLNSLNSLLHHPGTRWLVLPGFLIFSYGFIAGWILPVGINQVYAETVLRLVAAVLVLAGLVTVLLHKANHEVETVERANLTPLDLLLLLLPLAPILQYVLLNQDILSVADSVLLLLGFGFVALVFVLALPWLLAPHIARAMGVGVGLAISFCLLNMPAFARMFNWHLEGDAVVQSGILVLVLAFTAVLYHKDKAILRMACLAMFAGSGVQALLDQEPVATTAERIVAQPFASELTATRTPDIYLLTYDAYVENQTMLQYGIDNSAQETWLEDHGFQIYRGTYSVGSDSIASMGRVLARADVPREGSAGISPVLAQLEQSGYRTAGIFKNDYFFQGVGGHYDKNFPVPGSAAVSLSMAVLEGEFRYNAHYDKPTHVEFLAEKRALMKAPGEQPLFMYTHTGPGHSQNSGACRPDETQLFAERLDDANEEMKVDVISILENMRDSIVIINGDHGPYLTKNCHEIHGRKYDPEDVNRLDLQDRYGTFLAVRWPEGTAPQRPIKILQDVTPAVLEVLYPDQQFADYPRFKLLIGSIRTVAGVSVRDGIIENGIHAGEPLFIYQ